MTAALSLLSASTLAIALLVPLRDDRRGNRATIGGSAPLRPLFPARDPASHEGDAVPSAVSIRFGDDPNVAAPVEVLSRIVPDTPIISPVEGEGPKHDDPADVAQATAAAAEPVARNGFTLRFLAAAFGFHRPADRTAVPIDTSEPESDAVQREISTTDAAACDSERTFAEEVERLSQAPADFARDATVQISAMPPASEAADRNRAASAVQIATEDVSVKTFAEAAEPPTETSVLAVPDAAGRAPRADDVQAAPARASARPDLQSPAGNLPVTTADTSESSHTGTSPHADAQSPATKPPVTNAETTEPSTGTSPGVDAQLPATKVPATRSTVTTDASPSGQTGVRAHAAARDPEAGAAMVDVAPRAQATPIPIDRMRPPLTRLPLRPKHEEISWPLALSAANGEWSEAARHGFLRRAAERTDSDFEPILCTAFREESAAGRLLALRALARGSAAGTHAIFVEALRRGADEERALAVDVFGERGDREALVEALSDRLDAIAARAALACFGMSSRADLERALLPLVDRARSDAILGLLAGVLH